MPQIKRSIPVLTILVLLGLAGCSADAEISVGGDTVNNTSLEKSLNAQLEEQVGSAPKDVQCPAGISAKEGEKFECEGTAPDGSTFVIDVTLTDADGGYRFFVPPNAK